MQKIEEKKTDDFYRAKGHYDLLIIIVRINYYELMKIFNISLLY